MLYLRIFSTDALCAYSFSTPTFVSRVGVTNTCAGEKFENEGFIASMRLLNCIYYVKKFLISVALQHRFSDSVSYDSSLGVLYECLC